MVTDSQGKMIFLFLETLGTFQFRKSVNSKNFTHRWGSRVGHASGVNQESSQPVGRDRQLEEDA